MLIREKIKKAFDDIGFVEKSDFYGSVANRSFDEYSDTDLEIYVKNYKKFYKEFDKILKNIEERFVLFTVVTNANPQVYTVIWKHQSLYSKLDLRVYSKAKEKFINDLRLFNESLRPFYDLFIGAIRFVKYSKRKDTVHAMKFYRSAHESLIKIHPTPKLLKKYFFVKDEKQARGYFLKLLTLYRSRAIKQGVFTVRSKENEFAEYVIEFARNELK